MFECTICGLLSLGGSACPACGSQIRVDLAEQDDDGSALPNEVPGLDEAVASWNELEGIKPSEQSDEPEPAAPKPIQGSLPFGFSGASNTNESRLPFGIGSYAAGMPFDDSEDALPLVSAQRAESAPVPVEAEVAEPPMVTAVVPAPVVAQATAPEPAPAPAMPAMPVMPAPAPAMPAPAPAPAPAMPALPQMSEPVAPADTLPRFDAVSGLTRPAAPARLEADVSTQQGSGPDVPAMWRIDAAAPDMEQIYAESDQVVEVVHAMEAEDTVYAHEAFEPTANGHNTIMSLDIHPAQALEVGLAGLPELEETLQQGFQAIGTASWAQAAIAFQKLAARMPGDAAVFNNYGLSLLQRALTMAKSPDFEIQNLAMTQFESSILALREAAKSSPTDAVILLNLAHALLVSGRSEKAIGLIQMHDQTHPQTTVSGNLHAAALVSMGESGAAKALLQRLPQDDVVQKNLDRLSY